MNTLETREQRKRNPLLCWKPFYQELLHYIKSFVRALIETHVIVHYNTIDAPGNVRVH